MPRKRKFGFRRRFKRRSYRRGGLASRAMSGVRMLRGLVNTERHFFDFAQAATALVAAGSTYSLDNLVQGDAFNNRQGNSILVKSLFVNFNIVLATPATDIVCIIIYLDRENRAATPAVTDVLEAATVQSPVNHTNGKRFKILRDKRYQFSSVGALSASPKFFIKLNHHCKYNDGNAGTSADYRENHLFIIVMDNLGAGTCALYSRLRFIDN